MDKPRLLVVEDEEPIRKQMKWALADDYEVTLAENRATALERARLDKPPLVLLDLGLPPSPRTAEEGLRCLKDLLRIDPGTKVIVVTGNQAKENALKAIEHGAFDYFLKPADFEEVKVVLRRALNIFHLERENVARAGGDPSAGFGEILGECAEMQRIFGMIRKVANTDAPVLIEGESGTGKELIARAIHRSAGNPEARPFVAINCGAIPENLLESELFGHEKGSFTGADAQKKGKIEYADGGTLFLDEVGELPLLLQVKLLRFLQERQVERVGGRGPIKVTARVIAATNRGLKREIAEGRFREDLYYRLGVVNMVAPPLRDRGEDIVVLANHFLKQFLGQYRRAVQGFRADAMVADALVFLAGQRAGTREQGETGGDHEREEGVDPDGPGSICPDGREQWQFPERCAKRRRAGTYPQDPGEMRTGTSRRPPRRWGSAGRPCTTCLKSTGYQEVRIKQRTSVLAWAI